MLTIRVSSVGDHWVVHRDGSDEALCICASRERALRIGAAFAAREGCSLRLNEVAQVS